MEKFDIKYANVFELRQSRSPENDEGTTFSEKLILNQADLSKESKTNFNVERQQDNSGTKIITMSNNFLTTEFSEDINSNERNTFQVPSIPRRVKPFYKPDFGHAIRASYHLMTWNNEGTTVKEGTHFCTICEKIFWSKYQLAFHHKYEHSKNSSQSGDSSNFIEKPNCCNDCGESFMTKTLLVLHQHTHLNVKNSRSKELSKFLQPSHKCSDCGQAFTTNVLLVLHQNSHLKEKSFQCDDNTETLIKNLNLIHQMGLKYKVNELLCTDCNKVFKTKYNLMKHKQRHKQKPFTCIDCGRTFVSLTRFAAHELKHFS